MQGLYEAEFFLLHRIQELRAPFLDWFMERVSFLGNGGWLFIVTGLLLIVPKRTRRVGISVLLSLLCGFLIGNLFLKNAVMRSRPCWLDGTVALLVASPADYSFPSGHTLAAFESACFFTTGPLESLCLPWPHASPFPGCICSSIFRRTCCAGCFWAR